MTCERSSASSGRLQSATSSQTTALSTWIRRLRQAPRLPLWMDTASKEITSALKCRLQRHRAEKDAQQILSEATAKDRECVTTRTSRGGTITAMRVLRRDPQWTVVRWSVKRTPRLARSMRLNRSRIYSSCTFGIVMRSISMRERTITASGRSERREAITIRKWPTTTLSQVTGKQAMVDDIVARSGGGVYVDRTYELSRCSRYSDLGNTAYLPSRSSTNLTRVDERSSYGGVGPSQSSYSFK